MSGHPTVLGEDTATADLKPKQERAFGDPDNLVARQKLGSTIYLETLVQVGGGGDGFVYSNTDFCILEIWLQSGCWHCQASPVSILSKKIVFHHL